jgi:hypothetical protein
MTHKKMLSRKFSPFEARTTKTNSDSLTNLFLPGIISCVTHKKRGTSCYILCTFKGCWKSYFYGGLRTTRQLLKMCFSTLSKAVLFTFFWLSKWLHWMPSERRKIYWKFMRLSSWWRVTECKSFNRQPSANSNVNWKF